MNSINRLVARRVGLLRGPARSARDRPHPPDGDPSRLPGQGRRHGTPQPGQGRSRRQSRHCRHEEDQREGRGVLPQAGFRHGEEDSRPRAGRALVLRTDVQLEIDLVFFFFAVLSPTSYPRHKRYAFFSWKF